VQGVYAGCGGVLAVELKGGVVAAEAMMAVSSYCCRLGLLALVGLLGSAARV
jgi:hypothetical protein